MNFGKKNKNELPINIDKKDIANKKANELYEKQKEVERLEDQFKHTGNMDPEIMVINKKLLKLQNEVRQETDELLRLQNEIKENDNKFGLQENEPIEEFEKDMDQLALEDITVDSTWAEKDYDIINQYEVDKKLGLESKSELSAMVKPIDAKVHHSIKTDLVVLGLRLAIGTVFIVHGLSKIGFEFVNGTLTSVVSEFPSMVSSWGLPVELAFPIAITELLAGIFIMIGFLTRISSVFIGIIMLGAIFLVKGTSALIGSNGVELDLIILMCTSLLATFGPGKISVSNISIRGMIFTRYLH